MARARVKAGVGVRVRVRVCLPADPNLPTYQLTNLPLPLPSLPLPLPLPLLLPLPLPQTFWPATVALIAIAEIYSVFSFNSPFGGEP